MIGKRLIQSLGLLRAGAAALLIQASGGPLLHGPCAGAATCCLGCRLLLPLAARSVLVGGLQAWQRVLHRCACSAVGKPAAAHPQQPLISNPAPPPHPAGHPAVWGHCALHHPAVRPCFPWGGGRRRHRAAAGCWSCRRCLAHRRRHCAAGGAVCRCGWGWVGGRCAAAVAAVLLLLGGIAKWLRKRSLGATQHGQLSQSAPDALQHTLSPSLTRSVPAGPLCLQP